MTEALNHARLAMCIFKGGEYVSLLKAFCERIVVPGFPQKYLSCDLFNWIVEDGLGRTFNDLRSKEKSLEFPEMSMRGLVQVANLLGKVFEAIADMIEDKGSRDRIQEEFRILTMNKITMGGDKQKGQGGGGQ
jgi:hypothetical protein